MNRVVAGCCLIGLFTFSFSLEEHTRAVAAENAQTNEDNGTVRLDGLNLPENRQAVDYAPENTLSGGNGARVYLNSLKETEIYRQTMENDRLGQRPEYLTRAVLMDKPLSEMDVYISEGLDVNGEDPVFGYPLAQAVEQERGEAMVEFLLARGADPDRGNPLAAAITKNNEGILELLLEAGANPDLVQYGPSPALHTAVLYARRDAVISLLNAGADPNARDGDGHTALYLGLSRNTPLDVIQALLEGGANPRLFPALAAFPWDRENIPLALMLIEYGASGKVTAENGNSLVHWAVEMDDNELLRAAIKVKAPVFSPSSEGHTGLWLAVKNGNTEAASVLLQAGAPVNSPAVPKGLAEKNNGGNSFVMEDDLLVTAVQKGGGNMVKLLIDAGVDLNSRSNHYERYSALHKAITVGAPEIAALLLEAGATPDSMDDFRRTPLHLAVDNADAQSFSLLLQNKAELNCQDEEGETPLFRAVKNGDTQMMQALLGAGAKYDLANEEGVSPLHVAAMTNNLPAIRLLLDAGADVNAVTVDGGTPLWHAASEAAPETVRMLIEAGADVNVSARGENGGETLLHRFASAGNMDNLRLLLDAGADPAVKAEDGSSPFDKAGDKAIQELLRARHEAPEQ